MIIHSAARTAELAAVKQTENPFAAWNNVAATATLSGTAVLTDGDRSNAVSGTTFDYWLPDVTGTAAQFRITMGAAATLSCIGFAVHNLGTLGGSVKVERSTDSGATWSSTDLGGTHTPTDDSPIVFRIATTGLDAAAWRLNFTGLTAGDPLFVGVMFFGNEMVFPRRFYSGFAPAVAPTEVQLQSNVSVGGNLLGSSIIAQGSTLTASFQNVDPDFVRGDMLPFIPHFNAGKGFLFGWRPATYPQDVHYCWRDGATLRPANSGVVDFMAFDMPMRAFEA